MHVMCVCVCLTITKYSLMHTESKQVFLVKQIPTDEWSGQKGHRHLQCWEILTNFLPKRLYQLKLCQQCIRDLIVVQLFYHFMLSVIYFAHLMKNCFIFLF